MTYLKCVNITFDKVGKEFSLKINQKKGRSQLGYSQMNQTNFK